MEIIIEIILAILSLFSGGIVRIENPTTCTTEGAYTTCASSVVEYRQ